MQDSGMRTIIIGDVHGCLDELRILLQKMNLRTDDRLVFLGDLVDRGPDSAGVVQFARSLSWQHSVKLIQGNHEEAHQRWWNHYISKDGIAEQMNSSAEIESIQEKLSDEDRSWLFDSKLYVRLKEVGAIAVHAGIPFSMDMLPPNTLSLIDVRNRNNVIRGLQRLRYEAPFGEFVLLGDRDERDIFWAERYDGRFGHAYFGHNAFLNADQPVQFPHATGLDLGCVFGGYLAAAVLESDKCSYFTVKAELNYYSLERG